MTSDWFQLMTAQVQAAPIWRSPFISGQAGDVSCWHFSDVTAGLRNVCCWGKSGRRNCVTRLPSRTQTGPQHRLVGCIIPTLPTD
jgi:hypothetical protein